MEVGKTIGLILLVNVVLIGLWFLYVVIDGGSGPPPPMPPSDGPLMRTEKVN